MGSKYLSLIQEKISSSKNLVEAEVFGIKYVFTQTSTKDEYLIAEYSTKVNNSTEAAEMFDALQNIRSRTIASMLHAINGEVLPSVIQRENGDEVEKVLFLMEEITLWPKQLVDVLYVIATDLKKRFKESIRESVKYEWFGEDLLAKEKEEEEQSKKMDALEKARREKKLAKLEEDDAPASKEESSFTSPEES